MPTCNKKKVKLCKSKGKVCNKKTGRCNKVKPTKVKCAPKKVKLCKSKGKVCNKKTGRCNKVKPTKVKCAPKKVKLCKSKGKVCNKKTGRCNKVKPTKPPKPTISTKPPKPTISTKPPKPTGNNKISSIYSSPPPAFNKIPGFVSIVYYDLLVNKKPKRILFVSEYHEFYGSNKFMNSYVDSLTKYIQKESKGKDCLDLHAELPRLWTGVKNKNYLKKQKGKGPLSNIPVALVKKGLRIHTDDVRTYGKWNAGVLRRTNYRSKDFTFDEDDMLAMVFGIGPLTNSKGDILPLNAKKLKSIWNKLKPDAQGFYKKHLTWGELTKKIKPRARKSMLLFMKEHNISMSKLYPVLRSAVRYSMRGFPIDNFGYEAMNDIYSLFRMFRTFENKRKKPCVDGYQKNVIYVSHIGHAHKIMHMMYKLFKIKPVYSESINKPQLDKVLKEAFKPGDTRKRKDLTDAIQKFCGKKSVTQCDKGLGNNKTPLFFG